MTYYCEHPRGSAQGGAVPVVRQLELTVRGTDDALRRLSCGMPGLVSPVRTVGAMAAKTATQYVHQSTMRIDARSHAQADAHVRAHGLHATWKPIVDMHPVAAAAAVDDDVAATTRLWVPSPQARYAQAIYGSGQRGQSMRDLMEAHAPPEPYFDDDVF